MKMRREVITIEIVLYIIVMVSAAWIRMNHLGALPLSRAEARHALAAASVTPHASPHWQDGEFVPPSNPVYHFLTALLFHLFGTNNAIARFVNALAGTTLVLSPILARKRLGRTHALGLSIVFCFSPILITVSRTAGSPSLAALGIMSILMLLAGSESDASFGQRLPWIACVLGVTLATGADGLQGILTICIAALFFISQKTFFEKYVTTVKEYRIHRYAWITLVAWIVAVSGFGFSLGGLTGMAESIGDWFSGWFTAGRLPGITSFLMFPVYEPLISIFGLVGIYFAVRNSNILRRSMAAWFVAAFFVNLVYFARKPEDIVWVTLPMAILAADQLVALVSRVASRRHWFEFFIIFSLLVFLFAYGLMLLNVYASGAVLGGTLSLIEARFYPFIVIGLLVIAVLVVIFFALGWDIYVALESTGVSTAIFFTILTLSSIWHLNFNNTSAVELWRPQSTTESVFTLQSTVEMISEISTGRADGLSLKLNGANNHAELAWAMRGVPRISGDQDLETAPELILSPEEKNISAYTGQYIGQSFILGERWAWNGVLPPSFLKWWLTREAPISEENWLLLVRADLVPGVTDIISDDEGE